MEKMGTRTSRKTKRRKETWRKTKRKEEATKCLPVWGEKCRGRKSAGRLERWRGWCDGRGWRWKIQRKRSEKNQRMISRWACCNGLGSQKHNISDDWNTVRRTLHSWFNATVISDCQKTLMKSNQSIWLHSGISEPTSSNYTNKSQKNILR